MDNTSENKTEEINAKHPKNFIFFKLQVYFDIKIGNIETERLTTL